MGEGLSHVTLLWSARIQGNVLLCGFSIGPSSGYRVMISRPTNAEAPSPPERSRIVGVIVVSVHFIYKRTKYRYNTSGACTLCPPGLTLSKICSGLRVTSFRLQCTTCRCSPSLGGHVHHYHHLMVFVSVSVVSSNPGLCVLHGHWDDCLVGGNVAGRFDSCCGFWMLVIGSHPFWPMEHLWSRVLQVLLIPVGPRGIQDFGCGIYAQISVHMCELAGPECYYPLSPLLLSFRFKNLSS